MDLGWTVNRYPSLPSWVRLGSCLKTMLGRESSGLPMTLMLKPVAGLISSTNCRAVALLVTSAATCVADVRVKRPIPETSLAGCGMRETACDSGAFKATAWPMTAMKTNGTKEFLILR